MCIYFNELTDNQQATVRAIFADLPQADIPWGSVLDLFKGLNGLVSMNANVIRVVIGCQRQSRVGVFNCLNQAGHVNSHMILDLRDMLSGVGVEPY